MWVFVLLFGFVVFAFEALTFSGLWNTLIPQTFEGAPRLTFHASLLLLILITFPFTFSEVRLVMVQRSPVERKSVRC